MLTMFLLPTNESVSNSGKTVQSVKGLAQRIVLVKNPVDINRYEKQTDWYGILYDNEIIDSKLYLTLKEQLLNAVADVVVLYRLSIKDQKVSGINFSPRLFRRKVSLWGETMFPANPGLVVAPLLTGWIMANDK